MRQVAGCRRQGPRRRYSAALLLPVVVVAWLMCCCFQRQASAASTECLRHAATIRFNETKHTAQDTADGALDTIFKCIGEKDKYYVEFGTQDGSETNTRYFREHLGWTGLLMDGGNDRPEINLHPERLYQENIVQLFAKYHVPHPGFDLLSVDIDLNTFWVLAEILRAGYRPRVIIAEVNNNFRPGQGYAVTYMPNEMWDDNTCYYGASAEAFVRLGAFFHYTPLHVVPPGHNLILVANEELSSPLNWGLHDIATPYDFHSIWNPCPNTVWLTIPASGVDFNAKGYKQALQPVIMKHRHNQPIVRTFNWQARKGMDYYSKLYRAYGFEVERHTSRRALVPALTDVLMYARPCTTGVLEDQVSVVCERPMRPMWLQGTDPDAGGGQGGHTGVDGPAAGRVGALGKRQRVSSSGGE